MVTGRWASFCLVLLFSCSSTAAEEPAAGSAPRYRWRVNDHATYQVRVRSENQDAIHDYSGLIHYRVRDVGDHRIQMDFRGGLTHSQRPKHSPSPFGRPPFHPTHIVPRALPPWDRPSQPLQGLTSQSFAFTISDRGELLSADGHAQLPHLLGDLAMLPFQPLPASPENTWSTSGSVEIQRIRERGSSGLGATLLPSFRPPRPTIQRFAAQQSILFALEESPSDELLSASRALHLQSKPGSDNGWEVFEHGRWVWNSHTSWPESLDSKCRAIRLTSGGRSAESITVSCKRLGPQALARMKEAAETAQRELKQRLAENERPLSEQEKQELLASIEADDEQLLKRLIQLSMRRPKSLDADVIQPLETLLHHDRSAIRMAAEILLSRWSAKHGERFQWDRRYAQAFPVGSSERPVASIEELYPGLILQVRDANGTDRWRPAECVGVTDDGRIRVRLRGPDSAPLTMELGDVQHAHPSVTQPAAPENARDDEGTR